MALTHATHKDRAEGIVSAAADSLIKAADEVIAHGGVDRTVAYIEAAASVGQVYATLALADAIERSAQKA